jgi:hypothetical protein
MTHKECNGWTNYETWVVKLWMDNEEGNYLYWREQAEQIFEDNPDTFHVDHLGVVAGIDDDNSGERARLLADQLKEQHEEALPKLEGFAADLMSAALSEVDWEEIAESLLNDAKEALES